MRSSALARSWSAAFAISLLLSSAGLAKSNQTHSKDRLLRGPVVVFGNSWSDTGNFTGTFGPWPPPSDPDRVSNGLMWPDFLGAILRTNITPSIDGGTNYAWSGGSADPIWNFSPGTSGIEQVQSYLADVGRVDRDAIHIIQIGVNDLYGGFFSDPQLSPEVNAAIPLRAIETMIRDLVRAGAKTVILTNANDLKLDAGYRLFGIPGGDAYVDATVEKFNAGIEAMPRKFARGVVHIADLLKWHTAVVKHPRLFGLANSTEACYDGVTLCDDPNSYLYFNYYHLTEAAHRLMAIFYLAEIFEARIEAKVRFSSLR
jgi:outer membrane lipase/esterase